MALKLERIGIVCPRDLLFHLPFRYQDRTRVHAIGELHPGQDALIVGQVERVDVRYARRRSLVVNISDRSGSLQLRFFHFSAQQQRGFERGGWVRCFGEARSSVGGRRGALEIVHPEYRISEDYPQKVTEESLTPIYPSTEGITTKVLQKLVDQVFATELATLTEYFTPEIRKQFGLISLQQALEIVHRPPPDTDTTALLAGKHEAQQRLAYEELLAHHLVLSRLRETRQARNAPAFTSEHRSWEKLQPQLGFTLTDAQQRVIAEIFADLCMPKPAMRLIQGDVGSGKTVVAAAAALNAIDSGYQVAMMAPTELLSEQHRKTFSQWFEKLDISVEWLTGKTPAAARRQSLHRIKSGQAHMVIGTHALFQQQVEFQKLGLMIIDEQHRFGVDQRLALRNKASVEERDDADSPATPIPEVATEDATTENTATETSVPHQLIMSATPIPRSLAMIFYADLDVSNIDELPPGRQKIQTVVLPNSRRNEVAERIHAISQSRQQAYWVCPLIEESDKLQAQAATEAHQTLSKLLPGIRVELIHGRMKSALKEEIMQRFQQGDIDLLVATTVIEVGVDVPSASLMVIENAERLGLAQLHQLRGRVGRGTQQASCVLMYQPPLSGLAKTRLSTLRDTTDGFLIARQDLALRGPGDVLGTRQTGLQQMRVADLSRDHALLPKIEEIATALRKQNPEAIDAIIQRWVSNRESYAEV